MASPFVAWLLYVLTITAFVGIVSGIVLAFLWALRCALGLELSDLPSHMCVRRAVTGFRLIVGGILAGAVVVVAAGVGPFLALVLAVQGLFGDYPPAPAATVSLGLLIGILLLVAAWFARLWQQVFRIRLAELPD